MIKSNRKDSYMKSEYDTCTKDKVEVSYLLYAMLFELGLNPASKGTIYIKEIIEFIVLNNLYDYSYKEILNLFIKDKHYEKKNIKSNIKNSIYRIDYIKAKKGFEKYLNLRFDAFYLSPSRFINIIALKYKD